ncbi:MAG: hypothetical protein A4E60_00575 [Syntrophorhabdus sp. PtaB.Bin047]|jgi:hypothetical protein|nr:MAG: hypothetical protein A4E60_00575 [Syntrophorhabdus sp. PtaB.Bin047]
MAKSVFCFTMTEPGVRLTDLVYSLDALRNVIKHRLDTTTCKDRPTGKAYHGK